jgi:uncharacterized membrane protein
MSEKQQPQDPSAYPDKGIKVTKSITIDRPIEDLYAFWHDLTNLPSVMDYVKSIQVTGDTSHWTLQLPGGIKTEFNTEVYNEVPNEVIAWRSLEGSELQNAGSVRFKPAPGSRGTEVQLTVEFVPPAGAIGQAVIKLFGEVPAQYVGQGLREFKQNMEAGEIATTEGQPSGREIEQKEEATT